MNNSYIGPDELIYTNEGGIYSGGFDVKSIMMKNNLSPIMTLNSEMNIQNGGRVDINKVSDLFSNLVVPNWNLSYSYQNGGSFKERPYNSQDEEEDIIENDLHEKLLNLVRVHEDELKQKTKQESEITSKKKTRKINKRDKKTTKKNYKL